VFLFRLKKNSIEYYNQQVIVDVFDKNGKIIKKSIDEITMLLIHCFLVAKNNFILMTNTDDFYVSAPLKTVNEENGDKGNDRGDNYSNNDDENNDDNDYGGKDYGGKDYGGKDYGGKDFNHDYEFFADKNDKNDDNDNNTNNSDNSSNNDAQGSGEKKKNEKIIKNNISKKNCFDYKGNLHTENNKSEKIKVYDYMKEYKKSLQVSLTEENLKFFNGIKEII
jgi:hypothetical protein